MNKDEEMEDFLTLNIPKIPNKYKVISTKGSHIVVQDEHGNGVRVSKNEKNEKWKVGDIVQLELKI